MALLRPKSKLKAQRRPGRRRQQQQQKTTTTGRRTSYKGHRPEILQQSGVWINGSPKPLRELITIIITKLAAWQEFTLPCRLFIQVQQFFCCGNKFGAQPDEASQGACE